MKKWRIRYEHTSFVYADTREEARKKARKELPSNMKKKHHELLVFPA